VLGKKSNEYMNMFKVLVPSLASRPVSLAAFQLWPTEDRSVWPIEDRSVWPTEDRSVWPTEDRSVWPTEDRSVWPILHSCAIYFTCLGCRISSQAGDT